ncbi:MAG: MFS transporter, partial [Beijerinckiaceae bacterium]
MNDMTAVRAPVPHLVLLVALSALQPMALNIIAPSTPELARQFNTDYATVQLTLTAYLIAVATSQLITGPWSDRSGRRPVVLFGCATFLVGCLFAAIAPTIEALIFARVVQAIGSGTTFAMARAVIRDTSQRDEA